MQEGASLDTWENDTVQILILIFPTKNDLIWLPSMPPRSLHLLTWKLSVPRRMKKRMSRFVLKMPVGLFDGFLKTFNQAPAGPEEEEAIASRTFGSD